MAAPSCEGVYLINSSNPRGKPIYKIGRSCNIRRRMKEYDPTWEILCCHPHTDSVFLEKFVIKKFNEELSLYSNNEYFESKLSKTYISKFFLDCISSFECEKAKGKNNKKDDKPVAKVILTPLHEIKIDLINPDYPTAWRKSKKEYRELVHEVRKRLSKGKELDMDAVKETVYKLLDPIYVSRYRMNKITKNIQGMNIKDIPPRVVMDLIE